MNVSRLILLGAGLIAGFLGSPFARAADAAAGEKKSAVCAACHGAAGISELPEIPSLAGQPDAYVQWQLVYFRSGVRKNPVMAPLVAGLTDEDVRNLGAYYASLSPPVSPGAAGTAAAASAEGAAKLAREHKCDSCHGASFGGQQAAARLAFQREDYLLKALRDFKSGARTGGGVSAMPDAVYPLTDDDLKTLAHLLATGS